MKMTKQRILTATFGCLLALGMVPTAKATPITISGSGTWDAGTPTTAYSESGATWYFSFNLPGVIASNPTTQVTNFVYDLDGSLVTNALPGGVLFYSVADGGGFDLFPLIDNTSGASIISLFFPADVGSSLSIVLGSYQASIALNDDLLPGSGGGTVNITPEPPTIILLGTALVLGSCLIYFRKKYLRVDFQNNLE